MAVRAKVSPEVLREFEKVLLEVGRVAREKGVRAALHFTCYVDPNGRRGGLRWGIRLGSAAADMEDED